MDKDKKIEIQQKLIDKLTSENEKLQKLISQYKETIVEINKSKEKYEHLIKELEQLKIDYYVQYDMYRRLTDK